MGGQAFKAPRLNGFMLDPNEIVIVGGDGPSDVGKMDEDGELHYLVDERTEMPLSPEFVKNIKALGVKKNVIITKIGNDAYVVDGRQRVRAARAANKELAEEGEPLHRVPVTMQKGEEALHMLVGISTNEFNHDDPPLVKARKAQRLRDRGLTEGEIAMSFGVTTKALGNWEKWLTLSAPVKKAIEKGKVSPSMAAQLHDLPAAEQKVQLEKLIADAKLSGKAPTIKDAKAAVSKAKGQSSSAAPSKKVLRYIVEKKDKHEADLSDEFIAGVAFAIGLRDAKSINGLTAVMKAAKAAPAKKKKQSKAKPATTTDPSA